MANVRIPTEGPLAPGAEEQSGVTRRGAILNGAKLVVRDRRRHGGREAG